VSGHYIYLTCPAPRCLANGEIYTGNADVEGFEQACDYEGETISARCDEHADWTPEPEGESLADVVSDMQMQRHLDDEPCSTCGGDRLRPDFVTAGRCHVPKPTTTEGTAP
jgi:hypothetical protein